MNGNDLYQLSLTHPLIRKLIPKGFFPTLPKLQWEDGKSLIHFYYTCRHRVWEDCFCVTLSARTHQVLHFQRLETQIPADQIPMLPALPEPVIAYYEQCAEALSLKDPKDRQKMYLTLARKRTMLRGTFSTACRRTIRHLGMHPQGKTSLKTVPEKEFES